MKTTEVYKGGNTQMSFIVSTHLGQAMEKNDKSVDVNKMVFILIQLDKDKKAVKTVRFWMDMPRTLYLMREIDKALQANEDGVMVAKKLVNYFEYKRPPGSKVNRSITFSIEERTDNKGNKKEVLRVRVEEISVRDKKDKNSLYFDVDLVEAKVMALYVYSFLDKYMEAEAMKQGFKPYFKAILKKIEKTIDN